MYYVMSCRGMSSVAVERVSEMLFVKLEYLFLLESISFIGPNVTRNPHNFMVFHISSFCYKN